MQKKGHAFSDKNKNKNKPNVPSMVFLIDNHSTRAQSKVFHIRLHFHSKSTSI